MKFRKINFYKGFVFFLILLGMINSIYFIFSNNRMSNSYLSLFSPLAVVYVQPTFFIPKKLILTYKSGKNFEVNYVQGETLPKDMTLYRLVMLYESLGGVVSQRIVEFLFCQKNLDFVDWFIDDIRSVSIQNVEGGRSRPLKTWDCYL